jgi:hypothetical protein
MTIKYPPRVPVDFTTFIDTASKEELDELADLIIAARKRRGKIQVNSLSIGDTVKWKSGPMRGPYANRILKGKVVKINTTRVRVDTGNGIWNVHGSMLELV